MKGLYSIFDRGINKFLIPYPAETDQDAIRQCKSIVNDNRKTPFVEFPEDFDLYFTGYFNDETGTLIPSTNVRFIVKLADLKEGQK